MMLLPRWAAFPRFELEARHQQLWWWANGPAKYRFPLALAHVQVNFSVMDNLTVQDVTETK